MNQRYTVVFNQDDKFLIMAPCGAWKGKYTFAGRALTIVMNKNWLSGCRNDEVLKALVDDLQGARAAFPEEDKLQITLADSGGVIPQHRSRSRLPATRLSTVGRRLLSLAAIPRWRPDTRNR